MLRHNKEMGMNQDREKGILIRLNVRAILIILIFAFALFTRLYKLHNKALMHDECMFTYYSWHLAKEGDYLYQPILHGPTLEEMNALMFIVFGDSTYTMRLFPALCGLGIFIILLFLHSRFGREGLVAALALFALSPFLMFYTRFCRNDVPSSFFVMLTIYLYWKFFREGGGTTLVFAIISSIMLICIMENQIIFFFTIYTFAGLLFLVDVIKGWICRKAPEKKGRKIVSYKAPESLFPIPPVTILCLAAGMGAYLLGTYANYYEFKALGLLGVVVYLALMIKHYYRDVKQIGQDRAPDSPQTYLTLLITSLALVFLCWILYLDLFSGLASFTWDMKKILLLLIFFYVFLYICNRIIKGGYGEERLLRRFFLLLGDHFWYLVMGLAFASIIYIVLFSTWFKHPKSALSYYKETFEYWMGQHKEQRIKGDFHFYLPLLAIYELPALLIVLFGGVAALFKEKIIRRYVLSIYILILLVACIYFFGNPIDPGKWAKIDKVLHMTGYFHFFLFYSIAFIGTALSLLYLWRKERFNALLVYWSMGSFLGYSYAGEKVPWLSVHIALPILMLAAVYIQKLWNSSFFKKTAIAWYVLFALFTLWNIKSSIIVCFVNHSNIAERMLYSHASMDVPRCAEEVERIAFQLGTREKTRILVKGWAIWPMRWYLRNYDWTEWEKPETTTFPMVIMDYDQAMKIENITQNYQIAKYVVIQWWVQGRIDFTRLFNIWKVLIPRQYTKGREAGTDIDNSKAEWKKIWKYMIYRKIYEAHDAKWPSVSAPEMAFCVRKNLLER